MLKRLTFLACATLCLGGSFGAWQPSSLGARTPHAILLQTQNGPAQGYLLTKQTLNHHSVYRLSRYFENTPIHTTPVSEKLYGLAEQTLFQWWSRESQDPLALVDCPHPMRLRVRVKEKNVFDSSLCFDRLTQSERGAFTTWIDSTRALLR